jgi:two-component system LytT family sensor kinase
MVKRSIPRGMQGGMWRNLAPLVTPLGASRISMAASAYWMSFFASRRAQTGLLHAVIWVLLGMLVFTQPTLGLPTSRYYLLQAGLFVVSLGTFYVNVGWAVPQLLYRRRLLAYLLFLLGVVAVVGSAHDAGRRLLAGPRRPEGFRPPQPPPGLPGSAPGPEPGAPPPREPGKRPGGGLNPAVLLSTLLGLGLGTSVAAVQRGQRDALARSVLEQQQLAAELSLLKAQINPHFLFNTLNNIYALTLLDGEQARASIHRLSRMLRHVLYGSPTHRVPLSQEIGFLRDYVDLMQLRLAKRVHLTFEVPDAPAADVLIAPMLFQPFVENAFKHGVSATAPSSIAIRLRQPTTQTVELRVRNTLFADRPAEDVDAEEAGGIGLANTQRRLDLLYPGAYRLEITPHPDHHEYEVCLSLTL